MNKTININLGGFFFHIDEIAYQKLRKYLTSISKSLSDDSQGKNEIIADIEARISELLTEKITDSRQVVSEGNIEDIIVIMGQPEDYSEAEEPYSETTFSQTKNNISGKKLFRDGDDKFLGGVASGIAHYFDVDTIWIRLGLLALFFSAGFGILIYILLWILLPEAKTTAEKLQMEGEAVNIDNIEKKIREEFTNVSESVKNAANHASEKIKDGANEFSEKMDQTFSRKRKKNNGLQDFIHTVEKIIRIFFKIFRKFIAIILIFLAAAVILSLIIGAFSIGSFEFLNIESNFIHYPDFFFAATIPRWLLTISLLTLIGIPFLILLVLGLRILSSNLKRFSKTASLSLLGIWFIALLILIFTAVEFGTSHSNFGHSVQKNPLKIIASDTLVLKMRNNDAIYYQHNLRRNSRRHEVNVGGVPLIYTNDIHLDIKRSTTNTAYVIIQKTSYAASSSEARKSAEEIQYLYSVQENNLILDAFFLSDLKNIFKEEEIDITLYVPKGTHVYLDNSVKNFLSNVKNKTNMYDDDMVNHHFEMTNTVLKCTDCSR
ncbi:MAG: PspC domain-containing protein [Flavobacteriales bacterium]|jgi:phage shock protein PspC (stress-responsive transcriptional regulator)|tara:strand:+ start:1357 stop:2997 length:1641 start_codon:yes stop_codon:yes gene_type:complete